MTYLSFIHPTIASPDLDGLGDVILFMGTLIPIYVLGAFFAVDAFSAYRLVLAGLQLIVLLAAELIQWKLTKRIPMPARITFSVFTYFVVNFSLTFAVLADWISIYKITKFFMH